MVNRPAHITRPFSNGTSRKKAFEDTHGTHDCCLPLEHVVASRAGRARRWWVTAEVDQFLRIRKTYQHKNRHCQRCPPPPLPAANALVTRCIARTTILASITHSRMSIGLAPPTHRRTKSHHTTQQTAPPQVYESAAHAHTRQVKIDGPPC